MKTSRVASRATRLRQEKDARVLPSSTHNTLGRCERQLSLEMEKRAHFSLSLSLIPERERIARALQNFKRERERESLQSATPAWRQRRLERAGLEFRRRRAIGGRLRRLVFALAPRLRERVCETRQRAARPFLFSLSLKGAAASAARAHTRVCVCFKYAGERHDEREVERVEGGRLKFARLGGSFFQASRFRASSLLEKAHTRHTCAYV